MGGNISACFLTTNYVSRVVPLGWRGPKGSHIQQSLGKSLGTGGRGSLSVKPVQQCQPCYWTQEGPEPPLPFIFVCKMEVLKKYPLCRAGVPLRSSIYSVKLTLYVYSGLLETDEPTVMHGNNGAIIADLVSHAGLSAPPHPRPSSVLE